MAGPNVRGSHVYSPRSAYEAALLVYQTMASRAVPVAEVGADLRTLAAGAEAVWFGYLLALIRDECGMTSRLSYHRRRVDLLAMGCLQKLRPSCYQRNEPGAWALCRAPTPALWMALDKPASAVRPRPYRAEHGRRLVTFLRTAAERHPALLREAVNAGARTAPEVAGWLATLPEGRLRTLPGVCAGYHGGPHTCQVPDLDASVPSRLGGHPFE